MKKLLFRTILLAGLIVFPIMSMAQVNVQVNVPVPLPPPIPFVGPPNVVVLPGTDVYAVPDVEEELFFRQGWWWRHWGGNWYRSKSYDLGWAYYRGYPSWHRRIPHDWRDRYRDHRWGGHPWNHHGGKPWGPRGGHGGWGHPGGHGSGHGGRDLHGGGPGGRNLHGGGTGGRTHPDGRMNRSQGGGSKRAVRK